MFLRRGRCLIGAKRGALMSPQLRVVPTFTVHSRQYIQQYQQSYHQYQQRRDYSMFSGVSSKIKGALDSLTRKKVLTQNDVNAAMHNVKMALIQADVAQEVVDEFVNRVKQEMIGQQVVSELPKAATVYALVQRELTQLLGDQIAPLHVLSDTNADMKRTVSFILIAGTQGSGKTTTSAKLAQYIRTMKQVKERLYPIKCLLVSLDTHRPAAQEQLRRLAEQIKVVSHPVHPEEKNPINILNAAWNQLETELLPADPDCEWVVILDTAGRMQIDQELMEELKKVQEELLAKMSGFSSQTGFTINKTLETLLVADSMLGNEAVNIAKHFHDQMGLSGIVLTRLDGDARGGAAISMRARTGVPIKLIGTGEHLNAIDIFEPKGLADRIMGQGDVGAMARRAIAAASADPRFSEEAMKERIAEYAKGGFTFSDYLQMTDMFKKMGGVADMASNLPGDLGTKAQQFRGSLESMAGNEVFETHRALISHMTPEEVAQPKIIKTSSARRIQIAKAAGVEVVEVNKMLKMFDRMSVMASKLSKNGALPEGPDAMKQFGNIFNDPELMSLLRPKTKVMKRYR